MSICVSSIKQRSVINLRVGVGKKVRGQRWVQCSTDFSLVLKETFSGKHWCGTTDVDKLKQMIFLCLNHLLPLSFSSVCKKFPRESCHEDFSAADMGNPRHLQSSSTFHCEHCQNKYYISICIGRLCTLLWHKVFNYHPQPRLHCPYKTSTHSHTDPLR